MMEKSSGSKRIFEALETKLHQAIQKDKTYTLQNDAKFRAVEQNVATYEEFKAIVDAAHLQPITESDKTQKPKKTWNVIASNFAGPPSDDGCIGVSLKNSFEVPQTAQRFWQTWQKCCATAQDRFRLLKLMDREILARALASESSWCAIGEMVEALGEFQDTDEDIGLTIWVLATITKMKRFQLHLQLLSVQECQILNNDFQLLKDRLRNRQGSGTTNPEVTSDAIIELENKYTLI